MRHIRLWICVAVIAAGQLLVRAQTTINPTVTLQQLTANNTSASSNFGGLPNGVSAPGNVSKLPLQSLLYPGASTKIYAHFMGWFGSKSHINIGYNSPDPAQVQRQVADMVSRGISGVVVTWNTGQEIQQTAALLLKQAELRTGFDFALEEDVAAVNKYASTVGCDVTPQVIQDLTGFYHNFEQSSAYLRINNRPVVFFFGLERYYVDWQRVRNAVPGNPIFMIRNSGAFAKSQSDGGFSWSEQSKTNPLDEMLSYLDNFYSVAQKSPGKVAVGSVYAGFNDNAASWGRNRIVHQHCGQTWLDTFAEIGKFYSSNNQLRALQIVTWNDYEEGTAIESGIDNCVSLATAISGSKLSWSVSGNERTVDHYTVFVSTDGQNLMPLADVATSSHALDLASFKLAAGTYVLYVRAVGKPSILNKISDPVKFNPSDQPPQAALLLSTTSGTAPLTVTASSAGSTDSDGSVVASQIDFGDGSQVEAFTANHSYAKPGSYTVTATVTDNLGLFSKARAQVIVVPAQPGVLISTPAQGATLSSPVHVSAAAVSANPTAQMNVSVDGQVFFTTFTGTVDRDIDVTNGAHNITVQAVDTSGGSLQSALPVNVQTPGQPPNAVLALTMPPAQPPDDVLACTAASQDADHNLNDANIDFGDATPASTGPAVLHAYSQPGTYTVKATVSDDTGRSAIASQAITLGTGPFAVSVAPASLDVTRGAPASYAVSVLPEGQAFNSLVTLSCANTPPGAACSFFPSAVTPGAAGASATMTITTAMAALRSPTSFRPGNTLALAFGYLFMGGLCSAGSGRRKARRGAMLSAALLILALICAHMAGCGGGGTQAVSSPQPSASGTPFTITITGSSGSSQVSTQVQLVIH